eukprot:4858009-Alexandrium_andersonii.AAC.1
MLPASCGASRPRSRSSAWTTPTESGGHASPALLRREAPSPSAATSTSGAQESDRASRPPCSTAGSASRG